jgi:hypothetical protein
MANLIGAHGASQDALVVGQSLIAFFALLFVWDEFGC